jgi:hypothetical protein
MDPQYPLPLSKVAAITLYPLLVACISCKILHIHVLGTDTWIRRRGPAKSSKDIYHRSKWTHITRQVLIDGLGKCHRIGTDILVGIIVIHHHQVPGQLTMHS